MSIQLPNAIKVYMEAANTMYFRLAAKMADAIQALDLVSRELKAAQVETEDMYCAGEIPGGEDSAESQLS